MEADISLHIPSKKKMIWMQEDIILMDISINIQSSIKIQGIKTIYFDPIKLSDNLKDADYIFITHNYL